jgi:plastocyanin
MLAALGAWLLLAGLMGAMGASTARAATTHQVTITDSTFSPASLTIASGDTVTWTNAGVLPHTVTQSGGFDSGNLDPGHTYTLTLSAAGSYAYACSYHPEQVGSVTVQAAAPPSSGGVPDVATRLVAASSSGVPMASLAPLALTASGAALLVVAALIPLRRRRD